MRRLRRNVTNAAVRPTGGDRADPEEPGKGAISPGVLIPLEGYGAGRGCAGESGRRRGLAC